MRCAYGADQRCTEMAARALRNLRVDQCFLACLVDVKRGAFHRESPQASLKRTMMEIADSSTLLADASKFSKRGMHRIATLDEFDRAVVDDHVTTHLQMIGHPLLARGHAGCARH